MYGNKSFLRDCRIVIFVLPRPLLVLPVALVEVVVDFFFFNVVRVLRFFLSDPAVLEDDAVVLLDFPDDCVTLFPVPLLRDLEVEVFLCAILV